MSIPNRVPKRRSVRAAALAIVFAVPSTFVSGAPSRAAFLEWEIDETMSSFDLSFIDQGIVVMGIPAIIQTRNQVGGNAGPWNVGNTAAVDGTIATDYVDGVSIEFLSGQHDMFGLVSGSYRPNPAAFDPLAIDATNLDGQYLDTSSADGVYGSRIQVEVFATQIDAAFINFVDTTYDISSLMPLPITGTAFDSDALGMGFASASLAVDGVDGGLGQQVPDALPTPSPPVLGTNLAIGGTVTTPDPVGAPDVRMLTIPVDLPLQFDFDGNLLDSSVSGQIVAFATVPEPGSATLAIAGVVWLGVLTKRRTSRAAWTRPASGFTPAAAAAPASTANGGGACPRSRRRP